ncbi:putative amp-binding enzyme protein [Botrytis fragariae]|uniref:Putative amp-binding enzyme protein n=1 Tax=Botrytis fragariae TaxID=1964551 RepID=A0A8H6ANI0_9HELO|nr:putative amp-binding enzyme protein [Botrytis fragariae]KAF5870613.1 putative amp-binding enzyme protein [Botrytis fragariae]
MIQDPISASDRGRRLLPHVIDGLALSDPTRVFVSIPLSNNLQDGFQDITYKDFARSIDKCSWWMEENLGRSETFETLNYVGPQDLRYIILLLAAIKTGYQMFFNSPQNSLEGHIALLESLECKILLVPETLPAITQSLLSKRQMRALKIQNLQDLILDYFVPSYPYTKTFGQARYEPFVVLHTSGSTGTQKPIILTHGTISQHDTFLLPPLSGHQPITLSLYQNARVFIGLGLFHSAAICFTSFCIYYTTTIVLPPPIPMTPESSILTLIAKTPEYLINIKNLRYLNYGGGPLPAEIGNILKLHTHLFAHFGATETGFYALQITGPEDWEYMKFSPTMGIELRLFTKDLYELCFIRQPELALSQGVFSTFPYLDEYSSKDLFSKHPNKEGLWHFEGRTDDMIICSTGAKINPMGMEGFLNAHPAVEVAIVGGSGRMRGYLLVEARDPPQDEKERDALIEKLWDTIEKANQNEQIHGKITKELILFTKAEKPMVRAGKGTVLRKLTEELYREELNDLYGAFEEQFPYSCRSKNPSLSFLL